MEEYVEFEFALKVCLFAHDMTGVRIATYSLTF